MNAYIVEYRRAMVYHELGHAVAAEAVGYKVRAIDVGPVEPCVWLYIPVRYRDFDEPANRRRRLVIAAAGPIAEQIARGAPTRFEVDWDFFDENADRVWDMDESLGPIDTDGFDASVIFGNAEVDCDVADREVVEPAEVAIAVLRERWADLEARALAEDGP